MRILTIIIAGVVVGGGLSLWLNASDGNDAHLQSLVNAMPTFADQPAQSETPSGVCSMDPRFRPRPGQGSCSATP